MAKPNVLILSITGVSPASRISSTEAYQKKLLNRFSIRPMGAFQIAHHLRIHGFSCQVISFLSEFTFDEMTELLDKFIDATTIIGVSNVFDSAFDRNKQVIELLQYIKEKFPNNKIVIGGNNTTNTKFKFDAYFKGYSEDVFLEYVESHYGRRKTRIFTNLLQGSPVIEAEECVEHRFDIEQLDHRWTYEDSIINKELLPIEISRGCIFKCTFCGYRLNGKKKFDYIRDTERIVSEIQYNYEHWGITQYQFMDDTFNDSTFKVQAIHDALAKLPFKIEFWAYIRADLIHAHPEQIKLLRDMGLRSAFLGIETFNQQAASSIGKGLKVEKLKTLLDSLYYEHWVDVGVFAGFIIGLPYETMESQRETFEWQKQHPKWTCGNAVLGLQASSDNLSIICENPEQYGYTWKNDYTTHPDWETSKLKHYWVNNTGMSEDDARDLFRESIAENISPTFTLPRQFFYKSFGIRDFTLPVNEVSQQILKNYEKFVAKYKGKIWDIAKEC